MIEAQNINKSFGNNAVLRDVSFKVAEGESLAIIGRSGTGKSVLLKHLIGLLMPDDGTVRVRGVEINNMLERELLAVRRQFGMLFQGAALFDSMNVAENIAFPLRRAGETDEAEIQQRVSEMLSLVEMPGVESKLLSELSGGMRKRVGLARAIVHRPAIILYDEPTTGLDPVVSDSIDQLILRVRDQFNITSIIITHDMRSARRIGQRIIYLRDGQVYLDATAEEVFNSEDLLVSQFVNGEADLKEGVM
jgi:phospholipid/cholesterol/gamma-HCH transport system ATP-binding protein